jgi:alkanesulfonate monooxygenase SsuD/methylene tetrahydromethanopterin reductase-like flavin-dependent oxidoreductase (luciferase family)
MRTTSSPAVSLDEVSAGRLILGLGAGWHDPEHVAFGYPLDNRVSRFEEAMQIIAPLLRTGEVDFHGRYHHAPDCAIDPRGPRPSGPPILIGADGPRMLRLTARFADMWNAHYLGDPSRLAEQRQRLDAACDDVGRDPATIETTVGEWITFDDLAPSPGPNVNAVDGSVDAVVEMIGRYAELGVGHLMLQCIMVSTRHWSASGPRLPKSGRPEPRSSDRQERANRGGQHGELSA